MESAESGSLLQSFSVAPAEKAPQTVCSARLPLTRLLHLQGNMWILRNACQQKAAFPACLSRGSERRRWGFGADDSGPDLIGHFLCFDGEVLFPRPLLEYLLVHNNPIQLSGSEHQRDTRGRFSGRRLLPDHKASAPSPLTA
ncbi:hypothetical protein SRHO_G00101930 [Serrasalmus rhombeus]